VKIRIESQAELPVVAQAIVELLAEHRVVAFHGAMGAGKTTLIRAIAAVLGVTDEVTSPTFAIVNEYSTADGELLYHFDFYRIESTAEALDIGAGEYFDSGATCLVEWPENAAALLPPDTLHIHITTDPSHPDARCVTTQG
jgi:tRNA threonylcarbamoyladenosine biosynthesis protein TsaE